MEYKTEAIHEFEKVATDFAAGLSARTDHATLVALSGDLGAGKTCFVQAAAKHFGVAEKVKSPTFTIMQRYEIPIIWLKNTEDSPLQLNSPLQFEWLIHIDAYRLEKPEHIEQVGWSELLADPKNLIFLEWPEKIIPHTPDISVVITADGENRQITISS